MMQHQGAEDENGGDDLHHPEDEHHPGGAHALPAPHFYEQRRQHLQKQTESKQELVSSLSCIGIKSITTNFQLL